MARDHGFHPARITRVIEEAPDVRTFVLDVSFPYRAGQFLTFRACGALRSYSMSSSPDTDGEVCVTVKRVPGGLVSQWMHRELRAGDTLHVSRPAGSFCLREGRGGRPLVAFAGGSGITPVFSLVKSALATTTRPIRLLTAHQNHRSAIFATALDTLVVRHTGRFDVRHHLDDRHGLVTEDEIRAVVGDEPRDTDFYVCGPAPFMDLVERTLSGAGVHPERIVVERFTPVAEPAVTEPTATDEPVTDVGTVTVVARGQRRTVPQRSGETLLQTARRAGFSPPFSCESGDCATCMAQLTTGEAKMRVNNALDADEVAEGWVLTCQAEPTSPEVTVVYED
ncbi:ferredoxin--NADP reductase [Streptomyces sp. DH41]|uniref:ferredoxin--NADP reductase n=1 Tax=Streptomyces sp. DH41 TaxID=3040125 RepID=UPI0024421010|nr:ferredoxin--NADP reductase [Streptomyces sp. DH41]MDG9724296.1 ferredoxin--NADP reductase [Streptomyces sp. DH41]